MDRNRANLAGALVILVAGVISYAWPGEVPALIALLLVIGATVLMWKYKNVVPPSGR